MHYRPTIQRAGISREVELILERSNFSWDSLLSDVHQTLDRMSPPGPQMEGKNERDIFQLHCFS